MKRDSNGHTHEGVFSPIIDRNTAVPVSRVNTYQTVQDNQRELRFNIYQGEAREVSGNIQLGTISVPVPPKPAGEVTADVRFSYDSSGLLEVDVTIGQTGGQRNLVIVDDTDRFSEKDLAARREALAKLKYHPREEAHNLALKARADKTYEDLIGDQRELVGFWITEFVGALDSQDPRQIADARDLLLQRLDAIAAGASL